LHLWIVLGPTHTMLLCHFYTSYLLNELFSFLFISCDVPGSVCSAIGFATTVTLAMWSLHASWSHQPCWLLKTPCNLILLEMKWVVLSCHIHLHMNVQAHARTHKHTHTIFDCIIPHLFRNNFMFFSISLYKNTVYLKLLVYFYLLVLLNVCVGDSY
jgi:hypothetical protein